MTMTPVYTLYKKAMTPTYKKIKPTSRRMTPACRTTRQIYWTLTPSGSPRAQTLLRRVVAPCYLVLITKCHNFTQQSLCQFLTENTITSTYNKVTPAHRSIAVYDNDT